MAKLTNRDADGFVERRVTGERGVWPYIACRDDTHVLYGSGNGTDDLLVIRGGVIAMVGDDPELVGATEIYRGKNGNIEIVDRIPRWEKYGFCFGRDTGTMQTDFYSGIIGERDQKKKVHAGINEWGDIVVVRDDDGAIPYNKKNGVGPLSGILNRSRY